MTRSNFDALIETDDGFEIAERDLAQRGPGDVFGTRQSGLPTLRVGGLVHDHAVMEHEARGRSRQVLTCGSLA